MTMFARAASSPGSRDNSSSAKDRTSSGRSSSDTVDSPLRAPVDGRQGPYPHAAASALQRPVPSASAWTAGRGLLRKSSVGKWVP